jgi:TDG/mug DNA glycosylase family protein
MATATHQVHPFPPLYDAASTVLILGSFPSVQSRAGHFFYHHPQNRFWKVISAVFDQPLPQTIEEKSAMLHRCHVALWDVIASCEITGSSDLSIRNAAPNDLSPILQGAPIRRIFCNGGTSYRLYEKHLHAKTGMPAVQLPSTSPANAAWSLPRLIEAWNLIRQEE